MSHFPARPGIRLLLLLLAVPVLVGSKCIVIFSSNGNSDNDREKEIIEEALVAASGNFIDPVTAGLGYQSGELVGVTDDDGGFEYEAGKPVRFFIGDIALGEAAGASLVSPRTLVGDGGDTEATNIARLLHSLDADPADERVSIPASVRAAAVSSNTSIAAAIAFLDFSGEQAFVNAASQLVATLTEDYPHTATLLEQDGIPLRSRKAAAGASVQ